jgi:NADH-quinone oxidoreductase subunit L
VESRVALEDFAARPTPHAVQDFWLHGWGFDWLYEHVFVLPVKWFARVARDDLVEPAFSGLAWLNVQAWRALSASQNGQLRVYIGVAGVGLAVIVAFVVLR